MDQSTKDMIAQMKRDGYGLCKNCDGWEPFEVLRQMEGFCSSQCAREYND